MVVLAGRRCRSIFLKKSVLLLVPHRLLRLVLRWLHLSSWRLVIKGKKITTCRGYYGLMIGGAKVTRSQVRDLIWRH